MTLDIRQAGEPDVPAICAVIDAGYAAQVQRLYGNSPRGRWTPYDPARVRTSLDREAAGVRVGESQGEIVAVCMSRSYGSLGWFHTLGVHPQAQHRGFGRLMVADAEAYLSARGVRSIGLMTWPDAIDNISFYQQLGYDAVGLSAYAYRQTQGAVINGKAPVRARMLSSLVGAEFDLAVAAAVRLCDQILPGLNYTTWLSWLIERKAGNALLVGRDEHLVALALAQPKNDWLDGRLLLISPAVTAIEAAWTLEYVRRWALNHRFGSFSFPLDILAIDSAHLFQQHGFRLYSESMLNLARGTWPPAGIHCLRFSG